MIDRLLSRLLRQAVNKGLRNSLPRDPKPTTPEARAQAKAAQQSTKQARRALRTVRRFGKF